MKVRIGEKVIIGGALLAVIGAVALCVFAETVETRQWADFAEEHACKLTGRVSGDVVGGVSSNGAFVYGITPDKTAYTCNDGVTYWR